VKVYRGSPGILEVAGRARGRMGTWQKWSFPLGPLSPGSGGPAGWRPVRKRRRISRFPLASVQIVARVPGGGPGAAVRGGTHRGPHAWRGLVDRGLRDDRPTDLLRRELEAPAALVFAEDLPGGVELGPDSSRSYAE